MLVNRFVSKTLFSFFSVIFFAALTPGLSASSMNEEERQAEITFNRSLGVLARELEIFPEKAWQTLKNVAKNSKPDLVTAILISSAEAPLIDAGSEIHSPKTVSYADIVDFVVNGLGFSHFSQNTMYLHIQKLIAPAFAQGSSFYTRNDYFGFEGLFKNQVVPQILSLSSPFPEVSGVFELRLRGTDQICGDIEIESLPGGYNIVRFDLSDEGEKFLHKAFLEGLSSIDSLVYSKSKDTNPEYQALLNLGVVKSIREIFQSKKNQALITGMASSKDIEEALKAVRAQKNIKGILGVERVEDIQDLDWVKKKIDALVAPEMSHEEVVHLLTSVDLPRVRKGSLKKEHPFHYSIPFGDYQICQFLKSAMNCPIALKEMKRGSKSVSYDLQVGVRTQWKSYTGLNDMDIRLLPTIGFNPVLQFEYPYSMCNAGAVVGFSLVWPLFSR